MDCDNIRFGENRFFGGFHKSVGPIELCLFHNIVWKNPAVEWGEEPDQFLTDMSDPNDADGFPRKLPASIGDPPARLQKARCLVKVAAEGQDEAQRLLRNRKPVDSTGPSDRDSVFLARAPIDRVKAHAIFGHDLELWTISQEIFVDRITPDDSTVRFGKKILQLRSAQHFSLWIENTIGKKVKQ